MSPRSPGRQRASIDGRQGQFGDAVGHIAPVRHPQGQFVFYVQLHTAVTDSNPRNSGLCLRTTLSPARSCG
jgi:hypothetical protein